MTYYTFRIIEQSPVRMAVAKWEEGSIRPSDVYKVDVKAGFCTCVAVKKTCRHVERCRDLIDPEFINETQNWQWNEKDGWVELFDMPDIRSVLCALTS